MSAGARNCNNGDVLRWLRCPGWCVGRSWANSGVGDNQLVGFAIGRHINGYGLGDASAWPKLAAVAVTVASLTVVSVVVALSSATERRWGSRA